MLEQTSSKHPIVYILNESEVEFLQELDLALKREAKLYAWNHLIVERMLTSEIGVRLIQLFYRIEGRKQEDATIVLPDGNDRFRAIFSPALYLRYKSILEEISFLFGCPPHFHQPTNLLREKISFILHRNGAMLKIDETFPALGWYDNVWYQDEDSTGIPVDIDNPSDNAVLPEKEESLMELHDTVALMSSTDFKERFKAEYLQTKIRAKKLRATLNAMKDGTLKFKPKCGYDLLHEQLIHMQSYLGVLERRATIEDISLLWLNDGAPEEAS